MVFFALVAIRTKTLLHLSPHPKHIDHHGCFVTQNGIIFCSNIGQFVGKLYFVVKVVRLDEFNEPSYFVKNFFGISCICILHFSTGKI